MKIQLTALLSFSYLVQAAPPLLFNTPEADAILSRIKVLPANSSWTMPISGWPEHPDSDKIVASVGNDKPLRYNPDMAFVIIAPDQKKVPVAVGEYSAESDPGPYPVPDNLPIEGWPAYYNREPKHAKLTLDDVQRDTAKIGGDRHAIILDPINGFLWEFYAMKKTGGGWEAAQASFFNLKSNKTRPPGWTSSDAAGLPLFPAIVRYDELESGVIRHALRVIVRKSRREYVAPATHFASPHTDPSLPRMGERFRLRADFDISGFSPEVRTILNALKTYGMIVADNGLEWSVSVAPDQRIPDLHEELRRVKGSDFEVVTKP